MISQPGSQYLATLPRPLPSVIPKQEATHTMTPAKRSRTRRPIMKAPFRPRLECLEDRLTPSAASWKSPLFAYDAANQALQITSTQPASTVEIVQDSSGHINVVINGQLHSSDSTLGSFDATLSNLYAANLHQISLTGGGTNDNLVVGAWNSTNSLVATSDGAVTLDGVVHAPGVVTVSAGSVTVNGFVQAAGINLSAIGLVNINASANLSAGNNGIQVNADYFVNVGQVHADGVKGSDISVHTRSYLSGGSLTATGSNGPGGQISISVSVSYIDTAAASTTAIGTLAAGGHISVSGGSTIALFSSGRFDADGSTGGGIDLFGNVVNLVGANLSASGNAGAGGQIRIGGDFQGKNAGVPNAQTVDVAGSSAIQANGVGSGGRVIVWSNAQTQFAGDIAARGGKSSAGFIEVSSHGDLSFTGVADAGTGGTLLLDPKNLVVDANSGVFPQYALVDPSMGLSGFLVTQVLSNGNIVVDEQYANQSAGAIYLFNGSTGALISVLSGTATSQKGHTDILLLANGNFVLSSPDWNNRIGAVTWASETTGVSGVISAVNSLVGSAPGDIGSFGTNAATGLSNGNYVVASPGWNDNHGAVTWGSGTTGVVGVISSANSLIGATGGTFDTNGVLKGGDQVGSTITPLPNGDFVVASNNWNNSTGAVTWINGSTGLVGVVTPANSLIGDEPGDGVGGQIVLLSNGNYVVLSAALGGAVTCVDGTKSVTGSVSASNSLIGAGAAQVQPLSNGNYLISNDAWNDGRGFLAWGDGSKGSSGAISTANSLVGSTPEAPDSPGTSGDRVGNAIELTNGNYVVVSPHWSGDLGAATWGDGTKGVVGNISVDNSLVGSQPGDLVGGGVPNAQGGVVALVNGNYVIASPHWNQASGAVTWGDGSNGTSGTVSAANSIIGDPNDFVGGYSDTPGASIIPLTNGNYVVASPYWESWHGAITWANGSHVTSEVVSADNSLVGSLAGSVYNPPSGAFFAGGDLLGGGGGGASVTALANGNYVVASPQWGMGRGAATWGDGSRGTTGEISAANSLLGTASWTLTTVFAFSGGDRVGGGGGGVTALTNGNFVVSSPQWNQGAGAVTWGNGATGQSGLVSITDSLVGARTGVLDASGLSFTNGDALGNTVPTGQGTIGVIALGNGNYVLTTINWNTWADGNTGIFGVVGTANSIAPAPNSYFFGSQALPDNNFYLFSLFGPNNTLPYPGNATTWRDGADGSTLSGENAITVRNTVNTAIGLVVNGPISGAFITNLHTLLFVNFTDPNQLAFALAEGQTLSVVPDFITRSLNAGTSVVLQASNDIIVNSPILETPNGPPGGLTLQAGRSLNINADIDTAGGNLTLIANAAKAEGVVDSDRDPGNANISMAGTASLNTGTGALSINIENGADKLNHGVGQVTLSGITSGTTNISTGNELGFTIDGLTPGDGIADGTYTQTTVAGSLDLAGLKLEVIQTSATPTGSTFTLIHTTAGVTGTFVGLPEGATITLANTVEYRITYQADGGKDVVLTQLSSPPQLVQTNPSPSSLLVGDQINLTIQVQDGSGNLLSNYMGTATVAQTSGPNGGIGLGSATVSIVNGTALFQGLTVQQAGSYLLTIASNGVTSVVVAINAISTATQRYVAAVYQDVLGRPVDSVGLDYWVGQLDGGVARMNVAQRLVTSAEYYAKVIGPAYQQYLGRPADAQGLAYWIGRMENGLTDEQLESQLIASPEFYGHAGGTDKAWVDAMYQDLLGRQPDSAGETFWITLLKNGTQRASVADGFATSSERESQIIQADYEKYLGRTPSASEVSYWLNYFNQGGTNENIIANFTASDEYFMGHT
jgi:Repeat of unknown function (DUF5650)/Domain of unknown function (DUF4214)